MRVLVCSDGVGALSSAAAGRALAAGWSGHATAVVPAGEAGEGFLDALAEATGAPVLTEVSAGRLLSLVDAGSAVAAAAPGPGVGAGPIPYGASSHPLGRALAAAADLATPGASLVLDLVSDDVHDGGAGLLAALGAQADADLSGGADGLAGLSRLDLAPARTRLGGRELVGVLPSAQRDEVLLGLRGITSRRGRAYDEDPARLLATDASLQRLAELLGVADRPGAGAAGGAALAVLGLGGRLVTGPELALLSLGTPPPAVDLVVTGCSVFEALRRGGGVVAAAAGLAARLLCPCVVVAGEVLVGGREMRTMGVEAAYAVRESTADEPTGGDVTAAELTALATRVARSWQW